ncbi:hypothetical protein FQZ97_741570 [compost metagenome]
MRCNSCRLLLPPRPATTPWKAPTSTSPTVAGVKPWAYCARPSPRSPSAWSCAIACWKSWANCATRRPLPRKKPRCVTCKPTKSASRRSVHAMPKSTRPVSRPSPSSCWMNARRSRQATSPSMTGSPTSMAIQWMPTGSRSAPSRLPSPSARLPWSRPSRPWKRISAFPPTFRNCRRSSS